MLMTHPEVDLVAPSDMPSLQNKQPPWEEDRRFSFQIFHMEKSCESFEWLASPECLCILTTIDKSDEKKCSLQRPSTLHFSFKCKYLFPRAGDHLIWKVQKTTASRLIIADQSDFIWEGPLE